MGKSRISRECLDAASETLSLFTDSELSDYVIDVLNKARSYKPEGLNGMSAIEKAEQEVNNDRLKILFNDTKNKADNIVKGQALINKLKQGNVTIRNFLIKRYEGLAENISNAKKAAITQLTQAGWGKMTTEQFDFIRDKKNGIDVARALSGKPATAMAKSIADNVKGYLDKRTERMVNSGAIPLERINEDRYFRHSHDSSKMLAAGRSLADSAKSFMGYDSSIGKPLWRDYIKGRLNLEETFGHTDAMGADGKLNDSEVNRILDDIFDNITQGKNDIFSQSRVVNGKEEILKKRRMFFKFKDWENYLDYNEKYGTGDFFSAWDKDIIGSGQKIGIADIFGSNPYQTYFDLKKAQQELTPETASWRSKGKLWYRNTDLYFQTAMGIDQASVSHTMANFFGNLQSATSMAALPLVTVKSLSDMAYAAAFSARWGMSYWEKYGGNIVNAFGAIPSEERKYIAGIFMRQCKSELGFMGRFTDSHNSSELMKKANMGFYRGIGLDAFDSGNKEFMVTGMANHLGEMSSTPWNGLNDSIKKQLLKHDFKEHEWETLRKNSERKFNTKWFTTTNVDTLSDSQLKDIYEKSDKSIPISQLRNRLYNKVFSIFDVASENAVLAPGEFERAWLYQGHPPGTPLGTLLRAIAQFKAYPLAYIDRVLVNGFRDADGVQAKIGWGLQMGIGTLPLSLMSNYFSYHLQGLDFPDITQMTPTELTKFGMENIAGNLGVFLNIAEARNQGQGLVASQINTLPIQLISQGLSIPLAAATGHPDAALKAFKGAASHIAPIKTLPVFGAHMMGLLHDQPYLLPHQNIIYGYGK